MKKILISIIVLALLFYTLTATLFAEESTENVGAVVTEKYTADEAVTETAHTTEAVTEHVSDTETQTWSGALVGFIKENFTETSIITFATALFAFCLEYLTNNKKLKKHIGVLNGNAIEIATSSAENVKNNTTALEGLMAQVSLTLNAISKTAQEREELEQALVETRALMDKVVVASSENAELVANLLLMSNIPNSKKEEMYAKHVEAVNALKAIQKPAMLPASEEVGENDDE